MAHDDINGLNGVQGYLLISSLEGLIQGIEAHLGNIFNSHMENPIATFTRQGHFKLNLEIQMPIKLILNHWSHHYISAAAAAASEMAIYKCTNELHSTTTS